LVATVFLTDVALVNVSSFFTFGGLPLFFFSCTSCSLCESRRGRPTPLPEFLGRISEATEATRGTGATEGATNSLVLVCCLALTLHISCKVFKKPITKTRFLTRVESLPGAEQAPLQRKVRRILEDMVCVWSVRAVCLVCACCVLAMCLVCARRMLGLCLVCAWSVFGLCLVCACDVLGLFLPNAWSVFAVCSLSACDVLGLCSRCVWSVFDVRAMCLVCVQGIASSH